MKKSISISDSTRKLRERYREPKVLHKIASLREELKVCEYARDTEDDQAFLMLAWEIYHYDTVRDFVRTLKNARNWKDSTGTYPGYTTLVSATALRYGAGRLSDAQRAKSWMLRDILTWGGCSNRPLSTPLRVLVGQERDFALNSL